MTERGHNDDRAVVVDVVAGRKSQVRAAFKAVLLIAYAVKQPAKIHVAAFSDELVLLRRHPHRHARKVRQTADVVPMRMRQKNGAERFQVIARGPKLVSDRPPKAVEGDGTEEQRQGPKLRVYVMAKPGINKQVALRMLHQRSGHGKVAPLEKRASAITEGRISMVHARHHRENGQLLWRCGEGQRPLVWFWHWQR